MAVTQQALHERQAALIRYYLERIRDLHNLYLKSHSWAQEALHLFDLEWQQLQAQQSWACSMAPHGPQSATLVVAFPLAAQSLLMQVSPDQALVWLNDALRWVEADDLKTRYDLLHMSYNIYALSLDVKQMQAILHHMEQLSNQLDDDTRRSAVALLYGQYYDVTEDYNAQLAWSEKGLALAQSLDQAELLADATHRLGFACVRVYQYGWAIQCLNQALVIYQNNRQRSKEARVYNSLALNAYYAGEWDKAVLYTEQALTIACERGDRSHELGILSDLALYTMADDDPAKALLYARQAWHAARDIGHQQAAFIAISTLLTALSSLGLTEDLLIHIDYAREFMAESPSEYLDSMIRCTLASLAYDQQDWAQAIKLAADAAAFDRLRQNTEQEYDSTMVWGSSLIQLGLWEEAATVFSRSHELYMLETENPFGRVGYCAGLSLIEAQRGHLVEAQRWLDVFLDILAQGDLGRIVWPLYAAWHAYCAAQLLHDPRINLIKQAAQECLQRFLRHLTDESLRLLYLKRYPIRRLISDLTLKGV